MLPAPWCCHLYGDGEQSMDVEQFRAISQIHYYKNKPNEMLLKLADT
jgi:hypothetical protein